MFYHDFNIICQPSEFSQQIVYSQLSIQKAVLHWFNRIKQSINLQHPSLRSIPNIKYFFIKDVSSIEFDFLIIVLFSLILYLTLTVWVFNLLLVSLWKYLRYESELFYNEILINKKFHKVLYLPLQVKAWRINIKQPFKALFLLLKKQFRIYIWKIPISWNTFCVCSHIEITWLTLGNRQLLIISTR